MNRPNQSIYSAVLDTPLGKLGIRMDGNTVVAVDVLSQASSPPTRMSVCARPVSKQLADYFRGARNNFELRLQPQGTTFQQRVWRALQSIPSGSTLTYGSLAKRLHTSPRAVGNACRENPIPIIIPCHRVVAANGIGGYAGATSGSKLRRKKWLLDHEQQQFPAG